MKWMLDEQVWIDEYHKWKEEKEILAIYDAVPDDAGMHMMVCDTAPAIREDSYQEHLQYDSGQLEFFFSWTEMYDLLEQLP